MTKKELQKAQDLITNVLSLLGVDLQNQTIELEDETLVVQLTLSDEESGLFIGHQGENLTALQLILRLIISQRLGHWPRLCLNVGDYRQRRQDILLTKADQAAQRALATNQEIIIPDLNSFERHLVHEHLSQRADVATESRGEEPHRHLYVIPKQK